MADLKKLLEQKRAEREKLDQDLEQLKSQVKAVHREELAKLVKNATNDGMTIEELFEGFFSFPKTKGRKARSTAEKSEVADRYSDGTNTWSGRGAMPKWFVDAVNGGKSIRSLLIDKADTGDTPRFWYTDERGIQRAWDGTFKPGLFVANKDTGEYPYFTQLITGEKTVSSAVKKLMSYAIPGVALDEEELTELVKKVRGKFEL